MDSINITVETQHQDGKLWGYANYEEVKIAVTAKTPFDILDIVATKLEEAKGIVAERLNFTLKHKK